jgi:predicted alpha/beta hydrolase
VFTEVEARTVDGVTLRLDRVSPRGSGRGVVVCLHAMMTDGRYFGARSDGSFAASLAGAGFDVYVADFRGHGRSRPPYAKGGTWSFDELVDLDLPAIVTAAARTSGCTVGELSILGHSLGGLVSCAALGTGRIPAPKKLVLAATSVWLGGGAGLEAMTRKAVMRVYRGITRVVGHAPIRQLRVGNADESAAYVDQLTGWARDGHWRSRQGLDYQATLRTITVPTFSFTGATDWMCRPRDAEAIIAHIPSSEALRIVGVKQGDALDPDHFQLFTRPELTTLRSEVASMLA